MMCPNCSDVEMEIQDSGHNWVNFHAADDRSKYSCPACGYTESN